MVIENITDKTDGEIVSVLYTFDFQLDVFDTPSFTDYYKSGLLTIKHFNPNKNKTYVNLFYQKKWWIHIN